MVDKDFCISSYLVFRYVIDDNKDFFDHTKHQVYTLLPDDQRIPVDDECDIDRALKNTIDRVNGKKIGILLSGGMDSACLASYIPGANAYTFRFFNGDYQKEELKRAEYYANKYGLILHYVDIDWRIVQENLSLVMKKKGAPVHSIEPQICAAAKQAKDDGMDLMIIGDAADYVFAGMDGLYTKDWSFSEFIERYTYLNPRRVLRNPIDVSYAFEKYRKGNDIDFISFMHEYTDIESYASYKNAFDAANMPFLDPYEPLIMAKPLDLKRIRNGESKYLIRALFKMKYPELPIPQKLPMPRPVENYFRQWDGPVRQEFKNDLDMTCFSGNQKWQMYCLERFLNENSST